MLARASERRSGAIDELFRHGAARSAAGYVEILAAERGETVRAEPFEAMPLHVGIFFGDDENDEEPAQEA